MKERNTMDWSETEGSVVPFFHSTLHLIHLTHEFWFFFFSPFFLLIKFTRSVVSACNLIKTKERKEREETNHVFLCSLCFLSFSLIRASFHGLVRPLSNSFSHLWSWILYSLNTLWRELFVSLLTSYSTHLLPLFHLYLCSIILHFIYNGKGKRIKHEIMCYIQA